MQGLDVVLDSVGGEVANVALGLLAPFGEFVSYGAASGEMLVLTPEQSGRLIFGNQRFSGFALPGWQARDGWQAQTLAGLFQRVGQGALRVPIAASFSLDEAADAHRLIESRTTAGKVVLQP